MSATPDLASGELAPVNPATLEVVGSVPVTPPEALGEILAEARLAQEAWSRQPLRERSRLLRRVVHAVLEHRDEIVATVVDETGKPVVEALTADVFVSLDNAAWLAAHGPAVLRPERVRFPQPHLLHKRGHVRYAPIGVVAVISPWNFPFGIPFTQAATAVAAGNAVVVKPSELTPLSGAWVEEVFRRAGAPPGLVRVVQGTGAMAGDALVGHRGVHAVLFTGSTDAGRVVGRRAAERLCPATLELGGKDPMLVLDDADLARTVEGALWGAFTNCGQVCSGIERVYVAAGLYEPFVERLAARASELRIGRGDDPRTDLGPLVTEGQRAKVEALVADAVERGAELVTGGGRPETGLPGWFHEPTVLAAEPDDARIRQEEIFGPVVIVSRMDNEADGIRRANDSPFALGASVWTRSRERGVRVAAALEAGSVWVNDHAYSYGACQAPWGGRKDSGHGRTHSKHGLYAVSHITFTDADRGLLRPPWWYPYSEVVGDGFRGALDLLYGDGLGARLRSARDHRRGLLRLARRTLRR
ncbi:MAG: aldehyde dehydrogenase family protein [Thermoleophilia bacterium]|nr:aldehyde dehydrogenase family protein [Thermoleophilia bacterium]MDH5332277.1 aldehyde dehydrogenase family protein [Thermoleophilia bacterium]